MAYCTIAEMLTRYDSRRIAQLCADDGVSVTTGSLSTNANAQIAIDDAIAELNAACFIGKRYNAEMLESDLTVSGKNLLKRLISDLAFGFLVSRRGLSSTETSALAPRYDLAQKMLQQLREGERIFDTSDGSHADAGLAHSNDVGMASQILPNNSIVRWAQPYYGQLPVFGNNFYYNG